MSGCSGLTSLPEGFKPQGDVGLWGCTGLRSLPDVFKPQGNVELDGCTGLTSLPEGFNPQGYVYLHGCTGLTSLPDGFNPQGNVNLDGCRGLTSLPESLFNMPSTATINLENTGLNARVVADIIQRMNTPGYNGPRFVLSVAHIDYRTESDASANNLPSILNSAGHRSNHPIWTVVQSQTGRGSQWNILARFLTRLLNETPRSEGQVPTQLRETLGRIFTAMEREFAANDHQLEPCEFINSTLSAARSGIGTCIDKVKVGYVMMQLQLKKVNGDPSAERNIELLGRTIELVEGINRSDYVFDMGNSRFEKVLIEGRELSDDDTSMVCTVKIDGIEMQYTLSASTSDSHIKQVAIAEMNSQTQNRFRVFRIGDEVEDILNLTYALPEMESLHRIDMRFLGCRTMTEKTIVDAALIFLQGGLPADPAKGENPL
ncbi:MAG: hypothetical protein FJ308_23290 [Planctomycetes bacterium]|nr:hypothetical protein [Planctomycetota bacterium]